MNKITWLFMAQKYILYFNYIWMKKIYVIFILTTSLDLLYIFIHMSEICLGFTCLDTVSYLICLFRGCAHITNPMTLVWQDREIGDV